MICGICDKEYEGHFNSRYCCPICKRQAILKSKINYHKTEKGREALKRRHKNPKRILSEERYRNKDNSKELNRIRVRRRYQKLKNDDDFINMRKEKYQEYVSNNIEKIKNSRRIAINKYKHSEHGNIMIKIAKHKRRILEKCDAGITKHEWIDILEKNNGCCVYCGSDKNIQMDHIIPISKGGMNNKKNIQPLCKSCNCKKSNKIILFDK